MQFLFRLCSFTIYILISIIGEVCPTACTNKKQCKMETLSSALKTKSSYFSAKRFPFTFLNQTAIEKSIVTSEQHCIKKCLSSSKCSSINLLGNFTSPSMECHLLTQQAYSNKADLIHQKNSTHLSALNYGCESDYCLGNATCVPNYIDDTSTCVCFSSAFSGTRCETEKKVSKILYNSGIGRAGNLDVVLRDTYFKKSIQSSACTETLNGAAPNLYRAHVFFYFMPFDTGLYYFSSTCSYDCRFYITSYGKQDRKIFLWGAGNKKTSVYMEKFTKKAIEIVTADAPDCNCETPYSLSVTLPNGTIYSDISNSFFVSLL